MFCLADLGNSNVLVDDDDDDDDDGDGGDDYNDCADGVWCDGDLLMVKAKNVSERVTAEQPRLADDCRRGHIHIKTQNTTMK